MARAGRRQALDAGEIDRARVALESGASLEAVAARFGVHKVTLARLGLHAQHYRAPKKKKGLPRRWNYRG
jgi:hypothetical protein